MTCPSCGTVAPESARFCPSCGRALSARGDERRVVSVVFADVVGFTTFSESRDPEQVKNVVDRCFERLAVDITSFGGRVDKVVGDAIIALFGAPIAHEDDAERAVRAALQMQQTVQAVSAELGLTIPLRVGVNTGEVLVGAERAGGDYTAMGDVVNVASRLQALAQPGQVVVGPHTYAATSATFRYESLGALQARGREESVEAWAAFEALAPPGTRPRRVRTPLIGRDAEYGMLERALSITVSRRRAHVMLLLGEAGVGKSRLAEEVAENARCGHNALVLEGRCVPYGEANVWWPVAEAIRQLCSIEAEDDADAAFEKCRQRMVDATGLPSDDPEVERLTAGIFYLMGQEGPLAALDPARAAIEARRAVETAVRAVARQRPVLVVLSELHWADDAVLQLIDELLGRAVGLPVMVLATARPELESRWSPKPGPFNVVNLHVDALDRDGAADLLDVLLDGAAPADLRDALLERAGGNPFFLEELVSLLADAGMVQSEGRAANNAVRLPATLRGLVAARLDALPVGARAVIDDAAVLGRRGLVAALAATSASRGDDDIGSVLDELRARDLLAVDGSEWSFRSDLVREVAYDTLTKADRARRHFAIADWLAAARQQLGREDEALEQVAHHFAAAAELEMELGSVEGLPDNVRPRALRAIEKAAHRAKQRELNAVGVRLLDRAMRVLDPADTVNRKRVLLGRARAYAAMRHHAEARADIEQVTEVAERDGDRSCLAAAITVLGDVEQKEGALEKSAATLAAAVDMWREIGDERGLADALRILGMTRLFSGDPDGAERPISEALEAFTRVGDRQGEAWAHQNLAWIAFVRGDLSLAEERLGVSVDVFRAIGDPGGLSWAFGLLAFVRFFQGRMTEAGELAERILRDAEESGDRWAYGMTLTLLASVRLFSGDPTGALAPSAEAVAIFRTLGDPDRERQAAGTEARALLAAGRVADAFAALDDILTRPGIGIIVGGDGAVALLPLTAYVQAGAVGRARQLLDIDLVETGDRMSGDVIGRGEREVVGGMALLQSGDVSAALVHLRRGESSSHTEGERANACASLALGLAAAGDVEGALEMAGRLDSMTVSTYLDRALARAARGLALVQAGQADDAREALAAAVTIVDSTGDALAQAVYRLAQGHGLDALGDGDALKVLAEARGRLEQMGAAAEGWERAFATAARGAIHTP